MPCTCFAKLSAEPGVFGLEELIEAVAECFLLCDNQSPSGTGVSTGWAGFILPLPSPVELVRRGITLGDLKFSETIVELFVRSSSWTVFDTPRRTRLDG